MTGNLFDRYIKEKLHDIEAPVPDDMWERITAKQPKTKRGFWWAAPASMVLLLGVSFSYYFFIQSNSTTLAKQGPSQIENKTGRMDKTDFTGGVTNANIGFSELANTPTAEAANRLPSTSESNTPTAEAANRLPSTSELILEAISGQKDKNSNTGGAQPLTAETISRTKQSHAFAQTKSRLTRSDNAGFGKSYISGSNVSKQSSVLLPLSSDNDAGFGLSEESIILDASAKKVEVLNPVLRADFSAIKSSKALIDKRGLILNYPVINPRYFSNLYLEVYASPVLTFKKVEGPNNKYVQLKDSTESSLFSYAAGIRISKTFGKIAVKTGLEYVRINERFTLHKEAETKFTTIVTTNPLGQPDTTTYVHVGYNTQSRTNHYTSIAIPLILSYEFGNHQWRAGLSGGAVFNVYNTYSGHAVDESLNTVAQSDKDGGYYKTGLQTSLYGSVMLVKRMNPLVDVFAEPYINYKLSSMTSQQAPYSQKMHMAGLNLGVRVRLNPYKLP